jgi:hypothetical protein
VFGVQRRTLLGKFPKKKTYNQKTQNLNFFFQNHLLPKSCQKDQGHSL